MTLRHRELTGKSTCLGQNQRGGLRVSHMQHGLRAWCRAKNKKQKGNVMPRSE